MNASHLLAVLAISLLLIGCENRNSGEASPPSAQSATATRSEADSERASRVRVEVQGEPTVGPATVVVYVLDEGEGVGGAEVEVTGDMTHAGMTPVIATAVQTEPGLYQTEDFGFTMAGDWILTAEVQMPDGTTATTETSVRVAAP